MERTAGQKLIPLLPYGPGFLLVDEIEELNTSRKLLGTIVSKAIGLYLRSTFLIIR